MGKVNVLKCVHAAWHPESGLSDIERRVYVALALHSNDQGYYVKSQRELAALCKSSRTRINATLASLEGKGFLRDGRHPGRPAGIEILTPDPTPKPVSNGDRLGAEPVSDGDRLGPQPVSSGDTTCIESIHHLYPSDTPPVSNGDRSLGGRGVDLQSSVVTPTQTTTQITTQPTEKRAPRARGRLRDLTGPEEQALAVLATLPGYRRDPQRDVDLFDGVAQDYPRADLALTARDLKAKAFKASGHPAYTNWRGAYRNFARVSHERGSGGYGRASPEVIPPAPPLNEGVVRLMQAAAVALNERQR